MFNVKCPNCDTTVNQVPRDAYEREIYYNCGLCQLEFKSILGDVIHVQSWLDSNRGVDGISAF